MLDMDIKTMKMRFIERYKRIDDKDLLERLDALLAEAEREGGAISKEDLAARALEAEQDIAEGNTMTIEELEKEDW